MSMKTSTSILEHFADVPDFRLNRTRKHELLDIIVISICGVICGTESWEDVELFGKAKKTWLATFLRLPNGIPSHDTFYRVFRLLNPDVFQEHLIAWLQAVSDSVGLEGVATQGQALPRKHRAIDGKTLRHSFDRAGAKSALHLVSAWAVEADLTLGQVAVDCKSNEITAIPILLRLLDLQGALVTIDAMGCQKNIVAEVREAKADYVIAVKDNQPRLFEDVKECFRKELAGGVAEELVGQDAGCIEVPAVHTVDHTEEQGHGRTEVREVHTIVNPKGIRDLALWKGLLAICMVVSTRIMAGVESVERRYYIGSLNAEAKEYGGIIRKHWRIENSLHWILDVTFHEDFNRTAKGHGPQNLALLRRLAVSLLKNEKTLKTSVRSKRFNCALVEEYLLKVLTGPVSPGK